MGVDHLSLGEYNLVKSKLNKYYNIMDSVCKKCRRFGQKLFLKGDRCFSQKCPMIRKPYAPGVHGRSRRKKGGVSDYGRQLSEKQKLRFIYNISEQQLRKYFKEGMKKKGDIRELLISALQRRLDNVVFRLGWAKSRRQARQVVSHGHILVNGRKVNIPSYQVRQGQIIKIKDKSLKKSIFKDLFANLKKHKSPDWLDLNKEKMEAKVIALPKLEDVEKNIDLGLIIDFYSR